MPIVEVNGQELEFPDDMTPEAIKGVLQAKFPKPEAYNEQRLDKVQGSIDRFRSGEIGRTQAGFQVLGQGLGVINDKIGEMVPQTVKDVASSVYSFNRDYNPVLRGSLRALESGAGVAGNAYGDFAKNNPNAAANLDAAGNLAGVASLIIPGPRAVGAVADAAKVAPKATNAAIGRVGNSLVDNAMKRSLAKQVGADDLAGWSGKAYDAAHAAGGDIAPAIFNASLDKAAAALPKSAQAQAAFGRGATANYVDNLVEFRGKPLSFAAAEELDKGLGSQITQAYRVGDNTEAARLITAQQGLREAIDTLPAASAEVKKAKGLWSASANQRRIETILERAQYMEQPATAIKTGFRQLAMEVAKNPRGWTPKEIIAIQKAAKTGLATDALRIAGSRLVPMFAGASGGPIGAAAGLAASAGSRSAAEIMQAARAGKVSKAIMSRPVVQDAIKEAAAVGELTPRLGVRGNAGAAIKKITRKP
jgi:hypothetical protein